MTRASPADSHRPPPSSDPRSQSCSPFPLASWIQRGGFRVLIAGILALGAAQGIGRFAYTPLLPVMQEAARLDTTQAGLLASANYAGYLAGAMLIAIAVPGAWQPLVLRLAMLGVVITTAMMALTAAPMAWGAIRFVAGLSSAGVLVLASGMVLDDLRQHGQTSRAGWLYAGVGLGIAVSGLAVAATAGRIGWRGDWLLLALLTLLALAPGWRWLPRGQLPAPTRAGLPPLAPAGLRTQRLLFAAYFLEGVGYIVSGTFLVAIVERTPGLAGLGVNIWIVVGLALIPSTVFWGAVAMRAGFGLALTAAYLLQAVGIILPVLGGATAAFASAILFGGTMAGIAALTLTLATRLAPHRSAALIGFITAAFAVGQMLGPLLAGVIASRTGSFAPALALASILVLIAAGLMAAVREHAA